MNFQKRIGVQLINFLSSPRARHRVPVSVNSPCRQHKRIVWIGRFCQSPRVIGRKSRPRVGSVETPIDVQPFSFCCWMFWLIFAARPLLRAFLAQIFVAQACDVARLALRQLRVLFEYLSNVLESKVFGKTQAPSHLGENAPVVPGFSWRSVETGTKGDAAFRISHHPGFFTPLRCRQEDVSVSRGFRRIVSFLIDRKGRS